MEVGRAITHRHELRGRAGGEEGAFGVDEERGAEDGRRDEQEGIHEEEGCSQQKGQGK